MKKGELIYAFDWDNTLINSHSKGLRCMCKAFAVLRIDYNEDNLNQVFCPDYHEMFKRLKMSQEHWPSLDSLWLQYYYNDPAASLFPEVKEVLTEISKNGREIALISTGERSRVHEELEFLNIKEFFNFIICREDVTNVKPAPDAIELLKKQYNEPEIIYIGDHDHDVIMAQNAHVKWLKIDRNRNMAFCKENNIIRDLNILLETLK